MGIRTAYLLLTEEQVKNILQHLQTKGDGKTCENCSLFDIKNCGECSIKDKQIKHVLIENFIPLALYLVSRFKGNRKYEELVSVALHELVVCIERALKKDDMSNLAGYVNYTIVRELKKFILTDGVIPVKINHVCVQGNPIKIVPIKDHVVKHSENLSLEVKEVVESVISTSVEQTILECIMMGGYSNNEIAEKCGKSPGRISQIKGDLIERLMGVLN